MLRMFTTRSVARTSSRSSLACATKSASISISAAQLNQNNVRIQSNTNARFVPIAAYVPRRFMSDYNNYNEDRVEMSEDSQQEDPNFLKVRSPEVAVDAGEMKLFLAGLPSHTNETSIAEMFNPYGSVMAMNLIRDRVTGSFRGICFVLVDEDTGIKAIEGLNGTMLGDRPLTVRDASTWVPRRRLYVSNIPFSVTESELREHFEEFGEVINIKLVTFLESGKSKGYGFVTMDRDQADEAQKALDGKLIGDRAILVRRAFTVR